MDDKNENTDDSLEDNISYETYKLLLESQKEKEMNDIVENNNLTLQEKITLYKAIYLPCNKINFYTNIISFLSQYK